MAVNCDPGAIEWIAQGLGECVYDTKGVISVALGLLSTAAWIPAQFPQLWKNYKNQNVDGLAFIFLAQWLFGDMLNLGGCILTKQLPTQLYQAIYFCTVDGVLLTQYLYYKVFREKFCGKKKDYDALADEDVAVVDVERVTERMHRRRRDSSGGGWRSRYVHSVTGLVNPAPVFIWNPRSFMVYNPSDYTYAPPVDGINSELPPTIAQQNGRPRLMSPQGDPLDFPRSASNTSTDARNKSMAIMGIATLFVLSISLNSVTSLDAPTSGPAGRVLLMSDKDKSKLINDIGTGIAWSSACFYLGSRIPQILQNYRRKGTEGLSIILFMCAVAGNSFYCTSLFLNTNGMEEYIIRAPYILGSMGTLCFDFTIFTQFHIYSKK